MNTTAIEMAKQLRLIEAVLEIVQAKGAMFGSVQHPIAQSRCHLREAMAMLDEEAKRGTGRTTKALTNSPLKAWYVVPFGGLEYTRRLANELNRSDIRVVDPGFLRWNGMRGVSPSSIVFDHSLYNSLSSEQQHIYQWIVSLQNGDRSRMSIEQGLLSKDLGTPGKPL